MTEWIKVSDRRPPAMQTIIICAGGHVMVGWDEAIQPEEDPSWCSWEHFPEVCLDAESVTHWMPLPNPPEIK